MRLYCYEIKKLLSTVAVLGFVGICLIFNILLAINFSGDKYADFVGIISNDTGHILSSNFYEKLSHLREDNEEMELLEQLKFDTDNVTDVFDHYDITKVGESYIAATGETGRIAESMREKYSELQKVVDKKGENNESLTLYFASATHYRHQQLFNHLIGWLLNQGILITVLLVFLSLGYERTQRTEGIVYSSKKGRKVLLTKFGASISVGLGAFLLLCFFTLLIYFALNKYGAIWSSNVSSIFNYRFDYIAGYRPFVTWHSFSVMTYLAAMIGLSTILILCFSLMALGIAIFIRNQYIGFLVFLIINVTFVILPMQIPQTWTVWLYARYFSMLTPVWLWLKHSIWFTDGDVDILWRNFETLGVAVSLFVLVLFCMIAKIYFRKRDLI